MLFVLVWLGGAVALAGLVPEFGKWLLFAAALWLAPVGGLAASLAVLLFL